MRVSDERDMGKEEMAENFGVAAAAGGGCG